MKVPVEELIKVSGAVILTRESKRQLHRINKRHGGYSMQLLQDELAYYLFHHEQAGQALDRHGQCIRFDEQICVLIQKLEGIWYITQIWKKEAVMRCSPVYLWQEKVRNWVRVPVRTVCGWRYERVMPMRA